jgi:ferredoxin
MRAVVDPDGCQGYANCVVEAPQIFDLDEESGLAFVLLDPIAGDLVDEARRAEANCPARAIALEE